MIKNEIVKKVFCVDKSVNEYDQVMLNYYKQMFDPTELSFIVMPNNICNLKCIYCYQNHDKRIMNDLTIENFINAIKNYHIEHGLKKIYIEWFGGEPFMTFNIIKRITDELSIYFKKNKIIFHYGATTNGTLFNEEMIDYLLKNGFDYFQITLDGFKENHNLNRPFLNGAGSWDIICNNLLLFNSRKNYNFNISIRVNYNGDTFEHIDELFSFISENLDSRFTVFFHTIGKWGGKNDDLLETIDSSLEPFTTLMLLEEAIKYKIEAKTNYNFFNPFCKMCYAAIPYHFTIGSDGLIRKCNEEDKIIDKFNVVGTIENGKFQLDLAKWGSFVLPGGSANLKNKCKKCIYLPICFSQNCPKARIINKKNKCPEDLELMAEFLLNKLKYKRKI